MKKVPALRGRMIVNLFFEASTRTRFSFETAEKWLSADSLNFAAKGSSVEKGESLLDTARNLQAMSPDLIVIRHGTADGKVTLGGRRIPVRRPRVRTVSGVIHQRERERPHPRLPEARQDMLPQPARRRVPSFGCTRVWCKSRAYEECVIRVSLDASRCIRHLGIEQPAILEEVRRVRVRPDLVGEPVAILTSDIEQTKRGDSPFEPQTRSFNRCTDRCRASRPILHLV